MKSNKPQFELARVFSDGTHEAAEIVPITDLPPDMRVDRRGFLGAGIGFAAALLLMEGCATRPKPMPSATPPTPMPNIPVPPGRAKISYKAYDQVTRTWRYYTLPCGSPVPPGAICTCNCVPGTVIHHPKPVVHSSTICTCNKICVCVPVSY
jgi:hypothetical protein